jgi:RecA/RadA recombinase
MSKSSFIDHIVQKFDSDDVIKFSDKDSFAEIKSWCDTGSPLLNYNLHTFGLPTGIVEIAGKSKSGKTSIGLMAMKSFLEQHKEDGVCVILSSENRDNKDYALQLGIDVDRVLIVRVRYVEKMFLQTKKIIDEADAYYSEQKIKPYFFILWDSLGATLSKSELDTMDENLSTMSKKIDKGDDIKDLKHEKVGAFAKSAKMFCKYITGEMYLHPIHFVILNHQYDVIGSMVPGARKSTGGEFIELMPCQRFSLKVKANEKMDDVEVAQITEVKPIKNDFGSRCKTEVRILFGYGVILSDEEIQYAIEKGILKKEGVRKISFMGGKLVWSSMKEFYQNYYNHNPFLKVLYRKIKKSYDADLIDMKRKLSNDNEREVEDNEE